MDDQDTLSVVGPGRGNAADGKVPANGIWRALSLLTKSLNCRGSCRDVTSNIKPGVEPEETCAAWYNMRSSPLLYPIQMYGCFVFANNVISVPIDLAGLDVRKREIEWTGCGKGRDSCAAWYFYFNLHLVSINTVNRI